MRQIDFPICGADLVFHGDDTGMTGAFPRKIPKRTVDFVFAIVLEKNLKGNQNEKDQKFY